MEEEKYLPELMAERDSLDPSFVHASRLLAEEIEKFQGSDGKSEDEEEKYLDVISNKNIKLSERVLIPVKQYPKFNFVGKLLGPRGNSLKRLQEETGAKMSILGKGSMRDKAKTIAYYALLSMGFSRQHCWSGLPCPPPEDLPDPEIKPASLMSPALEGQFFTARAT